jgi:hypothetical protein
MYKKLVAVAAQGFRVARFSAERTFSLVSDKSANGTFSAAPSFN